MTEEQLNLLFETMEAIADECVKGVLGRDTLHETIRTRELKEECYKILGESSENG